MPPCHYIVNDASGQCVVLEYVNGELKIHDNPLGVITNSPTFDWHVTNLRNYVNLTVNNVPPVEISGIKLPGFGQGSGMLGLPGDFTPPSRFIRAVAFSQSALPVATADEGVLQAFHILNQFDIPKGAARGVEHGKRGCRLHALDKCFRPEKPPLLLPHVRQQPHQDDRPEKDGPRRQGNQDDSNGRKGSHRGPVKFGKVGGKFRISPFLFSFDGVERRGKLMNVQCEASTQFGIQMMWKTSLIKALFSPHRPNADLIGSPTLDLAGLFFSLYWDP